MWKSAAGSGASPQADFLPTAGMTMVIAVHDGLPVLAASEIMARSPLLLVILNDRRG
jgi:hypothetical protein